MARPRLNRTAKATGGLLAAAAVFAPAANANTYEVNSLGDPGADNTCDAAECTLREAVRAANTHTNDPLTTPDVVTFAPGVAGTINLGNSGDFGTAGVITIRQDSLDIRGPGADVLTVDGPDADRIFKLFGFTTPDEKVSISGLTLTNGSAQSQEVTCGFDNGDGGAIFSTNFVSFCDTGGDAAALTVSKVAIVGNEAEGGGGGIAVETRDDTSDRQAAGKLAATGSASLTVSQSTINANDAAFDGGGIAMYSGAGDLAVANSTIVDNNANGGDGGGIVIDKTFEVAARVAGVPPAVENSTVAGNDASDSGGGIATDVNLGLSSTIVSGNTVTPQAPSDLFTDGASISAGYSLFGTTSGASVTSDPAATNIVGPDPQLGPLQNNGGTTQTRLPATASPAVDKGIANGLTVDQRDLTRTADRSPANAADGTDIGAVEVPADPPPEVTPDPEPEPTPLPGPVPEFCFDKEVILTKGTDADEKITGVGADDGIFAGGGQDEVFGIGGDDCLYGQVGNDLVEGGPGNDNANGDRDDDKVLGDGGNDSVRGQNGNDRVFGGPGDDPKVTGGAGDDYVKGGAGDDFVKGDGGNDVIQLSGGADFVHSGGGADVVNAVDGERDEVICGTGKDVANVDPVDKVDADCNTVNVANGSRRPVR